MFKMVFALCFYFKILFNSRQIRECLKLDPEHKDCFPHYKKVKKVNKLMSQMNEAAKEKDYANCIEHAKKVNKI